MTSKFIAATFAVLTVLSGAFAGVAVAGTASAAPQDVSSCTVIDQSGEYQLSKDIVVTGPVSNFGCIEIAADNVTLDGNGHTITRTTTVGPNAAIYTTAENVEIRDLTVRGFRSGVYVGSLDGGDEMLDVEISDATFEENDWGVRTIETLGVQVSDSTFENNSYGISVFTEPDADNEYADFVFDSNTFVDNSRDIEADSTLVTVLDSEFTGSVFGVISDKGVVSVNNTYTGTSVAGINTGVSGPTAIDGYESDALTLSLNDTVVDNEGTGIVAAGTVAVVGATVENNGGNGIDVGSKYEAENSSEAVVVQSAIRSNDGDGVFVRPETDADLATSMTIQSSVIADNGGLGVNVSDGNDIANATGNYWGSADGPSSETTVALEDPYTGALANGSGDAVSEGAVENVSNVHFDGSLEENPLLPDAYQIDVAAGEVIENLGVDGDDADDEKDFYGTQDRLLQSKTVVDDGTVTGSYNVPTGENVTKTLDGCAVTYTPVSYDAATGEATLSVSVANDTGCENVTLTLAGYELPGDDTTFVRANADGQELVDYQTVTLSAGESATVTIDLSDEDTMETLLASLN
ncbi:hypothetical protein [Halomarina rubra]|uniref:Uncharacterized protein n=1 Tax=Halomarina rubra TaxID=2071873 RepID=A0ABD6AT31_9EURY|nr:hypothetical protein [Halomarina rubra]